MILDRSAIQAILPHRDPFLFLNSIEITEPGVSGTAILDFPEGMLLWNNLDSTALTDSLMLEGAAQLLGVVLSTHVANEAKQDDTGDRLLLSFDRVDFLEPADAGLPIRVTVTIVSRFGAMSAGTFQAEQQHRALGSGKIVVMGG